MRVQTLRGERGGEQARLAIRHWGTGILLVLFQPLASFRMFRRNAERRRPRRRSLLRGRRVGWRRFLGGRRVLLKFFVFRLRFFGRWRRKFRRGERQQLRR